ncbi:methyl-accepting chemotaxis protein [Texcoconibacillus texcoconensis]|uniref:Methyl-accepting chemotaxis protein n=1 Tax=Texcoconibacillus texcoconensis TaxID=1095777 RepID=A0A840QMC8_9BACI|nr:methyl-accepting chemotaxis protein [Texcoconibacillus texcoconensis]MBB5172535.1 methyl-accepting chemotaxis protein [Texcoconibacillus texcoconensis]
MKLTLKQKLIASFVIIAVIFGFSGGISYWTMNETNNSYEYIIDNVSELEVISSSIETNVNVQSAQLRGYLLDQDSERLERFENANEQINTLIEEGRSLATMEDTLDMLDSLEQLNYDYYRQANTAISLADNDLEGGIEYFNNSVANIANAAIADSQVFSEWLGDIVEEETAATVQGAERAMMGILITTVIAFIIAIVIGTVLSNRITKPIIKLSENATEMANGNLNVETVKMKSRDEVQTLNVSFEKMAENLREMIGQISSNAEQVAASSEELTSSADETTKATNQITESIQEVASGAERQSDSTNRSKNTVNEISAGMDKIVSGVESATASTAVSDEKAENGVKVVEKAIDQMGTIDAKTAEISNVVDQLGNKSKEIGSIISLITDVAEQTNLLALNAAIEAARAGEHGKGFAVVADEVRKLAEQSNQSANQISGLIQEIQQGIDQSVSVMGEGRASVQEGITYVNEAGSEFGTIQSSIHDISSQIQGIASAVIEMKGNTETVVESVDDAASVSEKTSSYAQNVAASAEEQMASMEEISAAAETLSSMAEELQAEVQKFRV